MLGGALDHNEGGDNGGWGGGGEHAVRIHVVTPESDTISLPVRSSYRRCWVPHVSPPSETTPVHSGTDVTHAAWALVRFA